MPRQEYVHVWEASARRYASLGRPRGRTGRSSDFARRLTSTRMASGATWCSAARSRAATAGRHTRNRTSHSTTTPLRGRRTGGAPARGRVLMRGAHRSRSSFPRAARGCAAQNRSVRQASSRIQTVSSLDRRAHRRIPVSTSRSSGRVDRRSTAASSRPTLASRGTYTARLRSSRTSGHHSRTASRNQARTARKTRLPGCLSRRFVIGPKPPRPTRSGRRATAWVSGAPASRIVWPGSSCFSGRRACRHLINGPPHGVAVGCPSRDERVPISAISPERRGSIQGTKASRDSRKFSVRSGVSEDAQGDPCGGDDRAHVQADGRRAYGVGRSRWSRILRAACRAAPARGTARPLGSCSWASA